VNEDRLPHLLLYGPPGTGKTSTILAVAHQIYTPKEFGSMVLEVRIKYNEYATVIFRDVTKFEFVCCRTLDIFD